MIVCCGESLIDMLPRKLASGENLFLPVPGGAIFNTAIALGRLGEETGFMSGVSTDMFGDQLIDALTASNVDPSLCIRSDLPTTLAFIKLTNGHAQYSFFDENTAGRSVSLNDLPNIPTDIQAMHFGAISLIPEPCGRAYETLMRRYHADTVTSLDPNIRPGFITDAYAHRARIQRMTAMSDIVKVSLEDLEWLASESSGEEMIEQWLCSATSLVLLTKGDAGVTAYARSGQVQMASEEVQVVDTVGAGDAFNAGMLCGLRTVGLLNKTALANVESDDLLAPLQLANRVAAYVVGQAGANPPWRDQI